MPKHKIEIGSGFLVGFGSMIWPEPHIAVKYGGLAIGVILILWGAIGAYRDRPVKSKSEKDTDEQPSASFDLSAEKRLVKALKAQANEYTNVKTIIAAPQHQPLAKTLDAIFELAGWKTNTNTTPQEHFHHQYWEGIEIRGFNEHLVKCVADALQEAGLPTPKTQVNKLEIPRDNPKRGWSLHKIYIQIGHH